MASVLAGLEGRPLRIMFQDEARFGRLPVLRDAWCPHGERPLVRAAVQREYKYIYGAVSPFDGDVDWMEADMMNTENMNRFYRQISETYPDDYILVVFDGASSHKSKGTELPHNIQLLVLPPYCPELNPVECLWGYLRRTACGNRYFDKLSDVVEAVGHALDELGSGLKSAVRKVTSMFCWPWMIASIPKFNWEELATI